jgi:hypothetical protein
MEQDKQHTAERESLETNTSDHDPEMEGAEAERESLETNTYDHNWVLFHDEEDEYNAEREEVERHLSDDDREFDVCYLRAGLYHDFEI